LSLGFKENNSHGIGEIETPNLRVIQRDGEKRIRVWLLDIKRQTGRLATEDERVSLGESSIRVVPRGPRAKKPKSAGSCSPKVVPSLMPRERQFRPIIQTGPFDSTVGNLKAERLYKMKMAVSGSAQPPDISSVVGYLRIDERHVIHSGDLSERWRRPSV